MQPTSLVTALTINTPDGVTRRRNVPLFIVPSTRGRTNIAVGFSRYDDPEGPVVSLDLTEAERISLIEALGGLDAPAQASVVRFFDRHGAQIGARSL